MSRKSGKDFESLDGILLLDKNVGDSSNRALQQARHIFRAKKAGHTGSLDPLASGLLPICFGEATKLSQYLIDADKRYVSTFRLGVETTTGDVEGDVVESRPVNVNRSQLDKALKLFSGNIEQVPPMYSALKKDGQPLYKLARKGIEIERKPRQVEVFEIHVLAFESPRITLEVHCSKGFYIRSLAHDLGRSLGCGAHVETLRRIAVGELEVKNAYTLEKLEEMGETQRKSLLLPIEKGLHKLPSVSISPESAVLFRQGREVKINGTGTAGNSAVFINDDEFVGIGLVRENGLVQPKRLLNLTK